MKEKYQNWADAARRACEIRSLDQMMRDREINNQLADFLQSLADMTTDEPDESMTVIPPKFGLKNGVPYVTKANRDWWMSLVANANAAVVGYQSELASKDARIKHLLKIIKAQAGEAVTFTQPLDVRDFGADQPPCPLDDIDAQMKGVKRSYWNFHEAEYIAELESKIGKSKRPILEDQPNEYRLKRIKALIERITIAAGGEFHGPNIEHLSMNKEAYLAFMLEIMVGE